MNNRIKQVAAFTLFVFIMFSNSFAQKKLKYNREHFSGIWKLENDILLVFRPVIRGDDGTGYDVSGYLGLNKSFEEFANAWQEQLKPDAEIEDTEIRKKIKKTADYTILNIKPVSEVYYTFNYCDFLILYPKKTVENFEPTSVLKLYALDKIKGQNRNELLNNFFASRLTDLEQLQFIGILYPGLAADTAIQNQIIKILPKNVNLKYLESGLVLPKNTVLEMLNNFAARSISNLQPYFQKIIETGYLKNPDSRYGFEPVTRLFIDYLYACEPYLYAKTLPPDSVLNKVGGLISNHFNLYTFYTKFYNTGVSLTDEGYIEFWNQVKSRARPYIENQLTYNNLKGEFESAALAKSIAEAKDNKQNYNNLTLDELFGSVSKTFNKLSDAVSPALQNIDAASGGKITSLLDNVTETKTASLKDYKIISSSNAKIKITGSQHPDQFNIYSEDKEKNRSKNYYSSITDRLNQKAEYRDSYNDNTFYAYGYSKNYPIIITISYLSFAGTTVSAVIEANSGITIEIIPDN